MLQTWFLWFYCLSILAAVLLLLLVTGVYLMVRRWCGSLRFWRAGIALVLLAWLAVIAAATLADRMPGAVPVAPELLPFHSYRAVLAGESRELLRSNFMNTVLFYPAGLLGCNLLPGGWSRKRRVFLIASLCVLLSLGIECLQYRFALGQAEVDDVIHNGLGALLGGVVCELLPRRTSSHKIEQNNAH